MNFHIQEDFVYNSLIFAKMDIEIQKEIIIHLIKQISHATPSPKMAQCNHTSNLYEVAVIVFICKLF